MTAFDVYALRYATYPERRRGENFCFAAAADGDPMPLDYFLWCVRGPERLVVVDTGASARTTTRRGRTFLAEVPDLLARIDVDPAECRDVVLTHLHWDHAGGTGWFPEATFHVQQAEIAFATGPAMAHDVVSMSYEPADVDAVRALGPRLVIHRGDVTIAPGLELHLVGGHTGGTQVVRVMTDAGWMVLASDALHFQENRRTGNPFPIVADVVGMLDGHRTCEVLADGEAMIVAGHDPEVRRWAPEVAPDVFELTGRR